MHPKAILSEERVQDSSDEDSSEFNEDIAPKPTVNGHAQLHISKLHSLPDNDDQNSESDTDSSKPQSRSSRGSKRKATSPPKEYSEPLPKRKKTAFETVKRIEASQYAPPRGYAPVRHGTSEHTISTGIFNNLEGKQIWHISAPTTVPISQIGLIDLQAVLRGGTVIEHEGTQYTMKSGDSANATILVPDNVDAAYLPTRAKVSKFFHIEEKSKAVSESSQHDEKLSEPQPNGIDGAKSKDHIFFATHLGQPKLPRKQPENLKARYIPFGVLNDRPNVTAHQKPRKIVGNTRQNVHHNSNQDSVDTSDSAMSGLEHDSDLEEMRPKVNAPYLSQTSTQAFSPSRTPDRVKKNTDGTSSMQGSSQQPRTPSSTTVTKSHEEKKHKKHKRGHNDNDIEKSVETPVSSKKTKHQSPIPPANALSTPVSSSKKKRKAH